MSYFVKNRRTPRPNRLFRPCHQQQCSPPPKDFSLQPFHSRHHSPSTFAAAFFSSTPSPFADFSTSQLCRRRCLFSTVRPHKQKFPLCPRPSVLPINPPSAPPLSFFLSPPTSFPRKPTAHPLLPRLPPPSNRQTVARRLSRKSLKAESPTAELFHPRRRTPHPPTKEPPEIRTSPPETGQPKRNLLKKNEIVGSPIYNRGIL